MLEYEYSFKVKTLDSYIEYCKNNKYKLKEESVQKRILYKNTTKVIARITSNNEGIFLDFKDEDESDVVLKISKESKPLKINEHDIKTINSMFKVLGYKKIRILSRKRIVYYKSGVKFELDEYSSPKNIKVVGIEGKKDLVNKAYSELET